MHFPEKHFDLSPKMLRKQVFLYNFWKALSLLFSGDNLKLNTLQFFVFLCKPHIWKILFQDLYVKCRVVQPDWRILWSSISMEGINSYHRLFELASETNAIIVFVWTGLVVSSQIAEFFYHQNICNQLIYSIWKYWFWFGAVSVASQIQTWKSSGSIKNWKDMPPFLFVHSV